MKANLKITTDKVRVFISRLMDRNMRVNSTMIRLKGLEPITGLAVMFMWEIL